MSSYKYCNNSQLYMALPAPTPPEKGLYTKEKIAVFSSAYMCQKPASLAYQEKKQLQEKSIIALKKKLWQMQAQKAKFTSNRKPG